MARRRKGGGAQDAVSLFPFLSILACVIGTLTLMITALALGQMEDPALAGAEELERLEEELAQRRRQVAEQERSLAALRETAQEQARNLATRREELARAEQQVMQAMLANEKPLELPPIPAVDEEAHRKRLETLAKELAELEREIAAQQKLLAESGKPPKEAEVQILPSGSVVDLDPTFVECAAGTVVIHGEREPERIRIGDLAANKSWQALLDRVAKSRRETVIFLVREDGLSTYTAAQRAAQAKFARNGKLPVIGQGRIDLSRFHEG